MEERRFVSVFEIDKAIKEIGDIQETLESIRRGLIIQSYERGAHLHEET